jgi:hypothetical protein
LILSKNRSIDRARDIGGGCNRSALADANILILLSLSEHSGHGQTCYCFDPVANDSMRTQVAASGMVAAAVCGRRSSATRRCFSGACRSDHAANGSRLRPIAAPASFE